MGLDLGNLNPHSTKLLNVLCRGLAIGDHFMDALQPGNDHAGCLAKLRMVSDKNYFLGYVDQGALDLCLEQANIGCPV